MQQKNNRVSVPPSGQGSSAIRKPRVETEAETPIETWRVFIAVPLGAGCVAHLSRLQSEMRAHLQRAHRQPERDARWTKPDSFHMTLRFVGDITPEEAETLNAAVARVAALHAPFQLVPDGAGCFPNARDPRVLWAGIGGELEKLHKLQQGIARETAHLGQKPETRPFQPHLTLAHLTLARVREGRVREGRVREGRVREGRGLAPQIESALRYARDACEKHAQGAAWTVREVAVIRSLALSSGGYRTLAAFSLTDSLNGFPLTASAA